MTDFNNLTYESTTSTLIAWTVILLGFIAGIAFILLFGQVEARNEDLDIVYEWSGKIIAIGIAIIANALLFGYLLLKISSLLKYHERKIERT
ncbi:conserved hypothetical protein [Acinetobacter proteolyticus]|uniref:Uncharacterized protein n=1 Tax=Acinetobacter proteolyticus TaxID=1776741 RepID=A0A653KA41_9GAMM|nr:hypothetical protein [Acinetobacter proteolyticus]VXA57371.1 conserved hypothetical protein [Acinetobacter proteolyticus]